VLGTFPDEQAPHSVFLGDVRVRIPTETLPTIIQKLIEKQLCGERVAMLVFVDESGDPGMNVSVRATHLFDK
jgi:hypothetical protein